MNKGLGIFIISIFLISCGNSRLEKQECSYNTYRHFRLGSDLHNFQSIAYKTIEYIHFSDSLISCKIIEDSAFIVYQDSIRQYDNIYNFSVHFDQQDLQKSYAKFDYSEPWEIYNLSTIKKQNIKGQEYLIYRFSNRGYGTTSQSAVFFTKEFGIIAQYGYGRGGLFLLNGIKGEENMDYLKISEKIIDDTLFLYSVKH